MKTGDYKLIFSSCNSFAPRCKHRALCKVNHAIFFRKTYSSLTILGIQTLKVFAPYNQMQTYVINFKDLSFEKLLTFIFK